MFHCIWNDMPQITGALNKFPIADHIFSIAIGFFNRLCTGPTDIYVVLACIEFCKKFIAYWIGACGTFLLTFVGGFDSSSKS